ncbi:MAG: tetratricopeptide repeat protein [Bdellovibrionaceae bacterium]|nr:tetratricopeptide repeat protein [Pseudobdellovibrionaceae bacterium]
MLKKCTFAVVFLVLTLMGCTSFRANQEKAILHAANGSALYQNENYSLALKEFLLAESNDPENSTVQNSLGLTYFMKERYQTAIKHFEKAIALDPKFTDARNNLARSYTEAGRYQDAEKMLKIVTNDLTYPAQERAYINLGLNFFNQKKYDLAKDNFLKAINVQPDNCFAHTYYGRSFFEMQNYDSSIYALDKAIEFCQKLMIDEPHYYSALSYYRLGQKQKSITRFEEVIKLYPHGKFADRSKGMLNIIKR